MSGDEFSPAEFAVAFQRFLAWTEETGDTRAAPFSAMFTEHFGADPSEFPVTSEALAAHDLPNLQLALDAFLAQAEVEHRLTGSRGRSSTSTCP